MKVKKPVPKAKTMGDFMGKKMPMKKPAMKVPALAKKPAKKSY
jgi:hypothetical protein